MKRSRNKQLKQLRKEFQNQRTKEGKAAIATKAAILDDDKIKF